MADRPLRVEPEDRSSGSAPGRGQRPRRKPPAKPRGPKPNGPKHGGRRLLAGAFKIARAAVPVGRDPRRRRARLFRADPARHRRADHRRAAARASRSSPRTAACSPPLAICSASRSTLKEMSPYLPKAVIATEDRRFYSHFGIDPIGLVRAAGRPICAPATSSRAAARSPSSSPRTVPDARAQLVAAKSARRCWRCGWSTASPRTRSSKSISTGSISAPAPMASTPRRTAISANRRRKLDLYRKRGASPACSRRRRAFSPAHDRDKAAARAAQVLDNMVEAGFITAGRTAARAQRGGPRSRAVASPRPGTRYFADWVAEQVARFRRHRRPRPDGRARRSTRGCRRGRGGDRRRC